MRPRLDDHLFARAHLSDALRAHVEQVPKRVQQIAESVLRAADETELVDELARELSIVPLELDVSRQMMRREEVQVDVTGDPLRMGFPDGRRLLVPGIRVTVSIPFVGDQELWKLRPSTFNYSPPLATVRASPGSGGGVLDLVIEQPADEAPEKIKAELDSRLKGIAFYLQSQRGDLSGFDATLRQNIAATLAARRSRLEKHDGLSALLGIPEVASPKAPSDAVARPEAPTSTATGAKDAPEDWDAFVSHASEDKEAFVRPLVAALTKLGLRIWFDEQELRVGDSLRRSIDRGLARSRYGVVVVSKSFLAKHWPQKELDGLVAREEEGRKIVLPVWHDITAAEVRRHSPTLADRLAVTSSRGPETVAGELLRVIRPT